MFHSNDRPLLLDLFCGAGGCAVGYHRAGFDVVGVDLKPQPRYPFRFIQADAMGYLAAMLNGRCGHPEPFDAIHASPPCQRYSRAAFSALHKEKHEDLVGPVRDMLRCVGLPWVIENVDGAPMRLGAIRLCGLMFGLKVFRHRWFESAALMLMPDHPTHKGKLIGKDGFCCVVGHGGGVSRRMREQMAAHRSRDGCGGQQGKAEWEAAMGIDWMTGDELSQAIPPAYTEFIGKQLKDQL